MSTQDHLLRGKNLLNPFGCRSPRRRISIYQSDELDSGCLSESSTDFYDSQNCSSRGGILESELKNEIIRSEKRRSALGQSLRNAHHALEHQRNCLQQRDSEITSSKVTLESLLMRQELLESRLSDLKYNNIYPDLLKLRVSEINEHQHSRPLSVVCDSNRITALEREINDIRLKMRSHSPSRASNFCKQSLCEERKYDEAEYMQMQEQMKQKAELLESKCSSAQRERDVLELQITSLHSGLHQEKVASKGLEKECVKLQSQIAANRNINESLYLEVSALKQHNQMLEHDVKGSESEKKSLHLQLENLRKDKQILTSQKELLFGIMRKKGKHKHHLVMLDKRTSEEIQISKNGISSYMDPVGRGSLSGLSNTSSHSWRLKRNKAVKYEPKDDENTKGNELQKDCNSNYIQKEKGNNSWNKKTQCLAAKESNSKSEKSSSRIDSHRKTSKQSEMNTEIIVACYEHLQDLLSKLKWLLVNNVELDHEKAQVLPFLLKTVKELQDSKVTSDKSREKVEQLLNEHIDLRENYHKRVNQITAVIIEVKHLRQAYNGIIRHSKDADDRKAMLWISRVQAIKDSLKLLQEQTANSLETKNINLFTKDHPKSKEIRKGSVE
ncbi:uncharacterized protein LOC142141449 [Mixophyes fleayi]|uniref:uncharacterized protein LOC142141449 n=1 Tax=Mixophyes fleayi TaxID=3061075 RepID=UPI003F4D7711